MNDTYKTVCNKCYRKTWYETEQQCHQTAWVDDQPVRCTGTLKVIDNSNLDTRFDRFYNSEERIEVTYKDGEKIRCYVGKTTGWKPVYIAVLRRNSWGGTDLLNDFVQDIRPLGIYK